jgi:hypothetical protein
MFNSQQLDCQIAATQEAYFCNWLQQIGFPSIENEDANEMEHVFLEDDLESSDEFEYIDVSGGIDSILSDTTLVFVDNDEHQDN